jgi:hypothetical protein
MIITKLGKIEKKAKCMPEKNLSSRSCSHSRIILEELGINMDTYT